MANYNHYNVHYRIPNFVYENLSDTECNLLDSTLRFLLLAWEGFTLLFR